MSNTPKDREAIKARKRERKAAERAARARCCFCGGHTEKMYKVDGRWVCEVHYHASQKPKKVKKGKR